MRHANGLDLQRRLLHLIETSLEIPLPPGEVTAETGLLGRGIGLDSIEVLSLVAAIEAEFGVTIDDSELKEACFATVGSLVVFVQDQLQARETP